MAYDPGEVRGKAAIVGVSDMVSPTGEIDVPTRALEGRMIKEALADAGLGLSDVDAVFTTGGPMASLDLAEYLRIQPRYTDSTSTGGSSFEIHVEHAAAAIALGMCEVALVTYAARPRGSMKQARPRKSTARQSSEGGGDRGPATPAREWDGPYGLGMPAASYSLAASRHMAVYGTKPEQLAAIAVSTREWACLNPTARYQTPITVEDVLSSPYVAEPLHVLDCCLVTDGAGAVVLTRADRARDLRKPAVYVLGAGTSHTHSVSISQMPDLTVTAGAVTGPKAFQMAGLKPADVDILMAYDSFTITALLALEDLGFCAKGEGGSFVEGGRLGPGGSMPTNTNGGGLSNTHPGMLGIFLLVEAVRQLRGEGGPRQIEGAKVGVAHGTGGALSCMSTVVLGAEEVL